MKNIFFAIALFLCLPLFISAQWSTDPDENNPINTMPGEQAIPKIATCPNGNSYIAFFCSENGNYNL